MNQREWTQLLERIELGPIKQPTYVLVLDLKPVPFWKRLLWAIICPPVIIGWLIIGSLCVLLTGPIPPDEVNPF